MREQDGRVALIAFDAAELTLVEEGVREGWMPVLADLMLRGRALRLVQTEPQFPGAAWPTTITGVNVAEHRLILDRMLVPGTYRVERRAGDDLAAPSFWRAIGDAGLPSVVLSVYAGRLEHGLPGAQAIGWGAPDPFSAVHGPRFEPPEVKAKLRAAVGRRAHLHVLPPKNDRDVRRYGRRLLRGIDQQTQGVVALMRSEPWAFFFAAYGEPHHSGHLLWHLEERSGGRPNLVRSLYRAVDAGIGRIRDAMPDDAALVVFTPHGMGPMQMRDDPLNDVLERGGWLVREPARRRGARETAVAAARRVMRRTVPYPWRAEAHLALLHRGHLVGGDLTGLDWARTQAFAAPADLTSFVQLNLAGREPRGIVPPGGRERLLDEIAQALEELVDADTGRPAVAGLLRVDEALGVRVDGLPDLAVEWALDAPIRRLASDRLGTIVVRDVDERTGHHRSRGFLIATGPGIAASGSVSFDDAGATIVDLAPTVLARLGVPVPDALHGRPLIELSASPVG
jgi:predicted AlkP superfamily phosphohydrolase/phosphomutase